MHSVSTTRYLASRAWPIGGSLAAIAATTAMDANGLSVLSALPLLPLAVLFWWLQGFHRAEIGLVLGRRRDYLPAVLYPLVVLGAATALVLVAGVVDTTDTDWGDFWINLVAGGLSTILMSLLTEEGFFRGWLWASLRRAGSGPEATLIWTSIVFSLWHVSAVSLDTGFDLPAPQIPIYLATTVFLGINWGLMRQASGSVVVASVSHGIWNGLNYALFAFSTKVGALGVTATHLYGPEVGWVGLALNGAFAAGLWCWIRRRASGTTAAGS